MSTLRLADWSSDAYRFDFEPATGRHTRQRLPAPRTNTRGYSGFAQVLRTGWREKVLVAAYADRGRTRLRVGPSSWLLHGEGLVIEHRDGMFTSVLTIRSVAASRFTLRYVHADNLARVLDSGYDHLAFELANLPANLAGFAARREADMLELWTREDVPPGTAPDVADGSAPGSREG